MSLLHAAYVPAGPGPHPTIFACHGFGSNALDLLGLAPLLLGGRVLMIAPQGPDEVTADSAAGSQVVGYGWFPLTLSRPPTPVAVAQAVSAAREFVDDATARYPVDHTRTCVLGFSQGGVIAYALALSDPKRFRALAALSSWLPDELMKALPALDRSSLAAWVQHGLHDEVITAGRGRTSAEKLREMGVATQYREYKMAHEVNAQSVSDLDAWLSAILA